MSEHDAKRDQENEQTDVEPEAITQRQPEPEFKVSVRKLELPARPRGVLAE